MMGLSEELFWYADLKFLARVAQNYSAYMAYINTPQKKPKTR